MSYKTGVNVVAYPRNLYKAKIYKGQVIVANIDTDKKITVEAQENMIHLLALSHYGSLLATCDKMGNVIKVFDVTSEEKSVHLVSFYRGRKTVTMESLNFGGDSSEFLVSTALESQTVHFFNLQSDRRGSILGSLLLSGAQMLTNAALPRSQTKIKADYIRKGKKLAGITRINKTIHVIIVVSNNKDWEMHVMDEDGKTYRRNAFNFGAPEFLPTEDYVKPNVGHLGLSDEGDGGSGVASVSPVAHASPAARGGSSVATANPAARGGSGVAPAGVDTTDESDLIQEIIDLYKRI